MRYYWYNIYFIMTSPWSNPCLPRRPDAPGALRQCNSEVPPQAAPVQLAPMPGNPWNYLEPGDFQNLMDRFHQISIFFACSSVFSWIMVIIRWSDWRFLAMTMGDLEWPVFWAINTNSYDILLINHPMVFKLGISKTGGSKHKHMYINYINKQTEMLISK